jgi:hypothetical protein
VVLASETGGGRFVHCSCAALLQYGNAVQYGIAFHHTGRAPEKGFLSSLRTALDGIKKPAVLFVEHLA